METTVFNSVNDFINSFKSNTFGLYVVTQTKPTFKSKYNSFMNHEVTKVTFYKNAVCGASYNSILFQHIKKDILKTEKEMINDFALFLECIGLTYDIKPMFEVFFKGLNKILFKIKQNQINDSFQDSLPWGNWLKYPFIISHKDNTYLRIYKNDDLTNVKSFYFINGNLIQENSPLYNLLLSELKPNNLPKKQAENGIRYKVIPFVYNIENILYLRQGNKIFDKTTFLKDKDITTLFKQL